MTKSINGLTVTTSAAAGDFIPIWRASNADTRKITKANFLGGVLTGAGTIATGGFTLTVAANSTINGSLVGNMTGGGTVATGGNTLTVGANSTVTGSITGSGTVATGGNTLTVGSTSTVTGSLVGNISGAGTIATGGFTGTLPATGTFSLLGTAQTYSALKTFSAGISLGNESLTVYDEGAWSPAITGSSGNPTITYTTQTGEYWRFNNLVFYSIVIIINTTSGGSGDLRISLGIASGATGYNGEVVISSVDVPGTPIQFSFRPESGQSYGRILTSEDNAGSAAFAISALATGDVITATGFYKA